MIFNRFFGALGEQLQLLFERLFYLLIAHPLTPSPRFALPHTLSRSARANREIFC